MLGVSIMTLSPLSIIIFPKVIPEKTHHYTLLDGEMIIDTDPNTQKQERRYLIYDVISINHVSVVKVSYMIMNGNWS